MSLECLKAAEILKSHNVDAEVIDLISIRPIDVDTIISSVSLTGRCLVVDHSDPICSLSSEVIAIINQHAFSNLKTNPSRLNLPPHPAPTSHHLAENYYPTADNIACRALEILGIHAKTDQTLGKVNHPKDQPDRTFNGPF